MTPPPPRFDVWIAALSAGYTPLEGFVAWADQRILADACQPRWVLELSLSTDAQHAEEVLWLEWSRQSECFADGVPALNEPAVLYMGFLYLMFRDGRISMAEMLRKAGIYADGQGYFHLQVSCETFYYLLNEIDGGGPTIRSDQPLEERVDGLFAPFAAATRLVLGELPDGLSAV